MIQNIHSASNDLNKKMRIMILVFLLLFLSNTYGTEWDCTGASNTGTFQRSTACTISGTGPYAGGVGVTNTLEIVGTVEDMNNLIVITAPSVQRHFYINGVNDKLVLRYLKLIGGDVSSYSNYPNNAGGSIFIYTSGGTLLLYSSIIANNQAVNGGGIAASGDPSNIEKTNVIINRTIITKNKATSSINGQSYGGGCWIVNGNGILVRTSISKNTAGVQGGGGGLYLSKGSSTDTMTVQIRETTFTANNGNNYGNEIYVGGTPTISIVNTLFNQPVDSNRNFYDQHEGATWNTCANNVCTDTPFTGTCTAVNNANTKYGVFCQYNNNYKSDCFPGTSLIIGGVQTGQLGCHPCATGTYQDEPNKATCKTCNAGTYNTEEGQLSISSCKPCEKGYQCPRRSKVQQQCDAGTYQDEPSQTTCKNCEPGKYGTETRQTAEVQACTTCPLGKVSSCGSSGASSTNGGMLCNAPYTTCIPCDANYYSTDGKSCNRCTGDKVSPRGSAACYDLSSMLQNMHSLSEQQGGIIKSLALSNAKSNEVKQKANGLIAKLSLNWATQDVINEAQILRDKLSKLPDYNVTHHCEQEKERLAYGVLRTGIIVPTNAEIDDKYCLNENRDRLISSFCNFRPRFIKLLQEKLYPRLPLLPKYTGRDLWPNICCRKDNFQHLKTCNDPSGKVPRSHIVPFALAQGGNITVDNLYGEIVDVLKKDGYLQQGMNKAVEGIKDGDKLQQKVNNLFETTLLCGPREFGLPTNEAIRLCELFYPYEHMLATYYNEVNALLKPLQRRRRRRMLGVWSGITNLMSSASAFVFGDGDEADVNDQANLIRRLEDKMEVLEKKDAILEKKDAISRNEIQDLKQDLNQKDTISRKKIQHLEKKDAIIQRQSNKTNTFLSILKRNGISKRRLGTTSDALCPFVTMSDVSEYEKDIDTFCTGYTHIDLNHPGTVINLAIMTPWDIPAKMIPELREKARYEISDDCPTPMFTAKDISLQNIDGTDLFVVQLDATSPNGYLRKELPQCGAANNIALKPHIPKTTIDVKIWRDHEDCCKDTKDYKVCKAIKCLPTDDPNGIEPVNDPWTKQQVGYHYKVIGTTYTATCDNKPNSKPCGSNARRRSLLQDEYGNSGERL